MTAGHMSYGSTIRGFDATNPDVRALPDLALKNSLRDPADHDPITINAPLFLRIPIKGAR
jgi:hypothetical protein